VLFKTATKPTDMAESGPDLACRRLTSATWTAVNHASELTLPSAVSQLFSNFTIPRVLTYCPASRYSTHISILKNTWKSHDLGCPFPSIVTSEDVPSLRAAPSFPRMASEMNNLTTLIKR
jgi:hypothetical protein